MSLPKRNGEIEVVGLNKIHTYVGGEKTTNGYGLLLINMENGISLLYAETGRQKRD